MTLPDDLDALASNPIAHQFSVEGEKAATILRLAAKWMREYDRLPHDRDGVPILPGMMVTLGDEPEVYRVHAIVDCVVDPVCLDLNGMDCHVPGESCVVVGRGGEEQR